MADIFPQHIREWITRMQREGQSAWTIQYCKSSILSSIFTTALNDQVTYIHPCRGVRIPTVPTTMRTIITPEQFDVVYGTLPDADAQLLAATDRGAWHPARLAPAHRQEQVGLPECHGAPAGPAGAPRAAAPATAGHIPALRHAGRIFPVAVTGGRSLSTRRPSAASTSSSAGRHRWGTAGLDARLAVIGRAGVGTQVLSAFPQLPPAWTRRPRWRGPGRRRPVRRPGPVR